MPGNSLFDPVQQQFRYGSADQIRINLRISDPIRVHGRLVKHRNLHLFRNLNLHDGKKIDQFRRVICTVTEHAIRVTVPHGFCGILGRDSIGQLECLQSMEAAEFPISLSPCPDAGMGRMVEKAE